MFFRKNRRLLQEARTEIESLLRRVEQADDTERHLRHLLSIKEEECESLYSRVKRLQRKADSADAMEERLAEIEEQVNRFADLKQELEKRIQVLRLQRDEARAMIRARGIQSPSIDFIDTASLPEPPKEAPKKKPAVRPADSNDVSDWYIPLPDDC